MKVEIRLDAPKSESLRFLLEEMVSDPFVGAFKTQKPSEWIEKYCERIDERFAKDELSTVAYVGSGIVGIAFSRPLGNQSLCANMREPNDYWKMGNFYVLKDFRGNGIGKQALKTFLEHKEGKVCYFADRENGASNRVAQACGMIQTHDFANPKYTNKYMTGTSDFTIDRPAWYFHSYTGLVPPNELLVKPNLVSVKEQL